MKKLEIIKRDIRFIKPAKTSRNTFSHREINYLLLTDNNGVSGIGESSPLSLLSIDDVENYGQILQETVDHINDGADWRELDLKAFPSIQFGLEIAYADYRHGGNHIISDNNFIKGIPIPINGLIWMDEIEYMRQSVDMKVKEGFDVIKLKIGAHDFDSECRLLEDIRRNYTSGKISLRLDANGSFEPEDALLKIKELSRFDIHSIEQPIKAGQLDDMSKICSDTNIPIALDEELIGVDVSSEGNRLLSEIKPDYLIIKPNLIGGLSVSDEWVRLAMDSNIGWWATSALETNIGLNAIAQWVSKYEPRIPQGLGTGSLYANNIKSPLEVKRGQLQYNRSKSWEKLSPERA